jgi:diguanylate cyclase
LISIGLQHSLGLVALSLLFAVFGGYLGLGLAAKARDADGNRQKIFLASAAWALALGVWTMHFVGILAAYFPSPIRFSVLPTLISFLICVLVVGISAFIESRQTQGGWLTVVSALFMGAGIVSMHYVGMHAIDGSFMMVHDWRFVLLSAVLAFAASYGTLRRFEADLSTRALASAAVVFGLAVSGMHYLAMLGMQIDTSMRMEHMSDATISSGTLAMAVALLAFVVSGLFLLSLVPNATRTAPSEANITNLSELENPVEDSEQRRKPIASEASVSINIPIESEGTTKFVECNKICAIQATTHYTLIYDGVKEYFSPWSISEAEERLMEKGFMKVHRSHLIAISKVNAIKKVGTEAAVEVGAPLSRTVPVSRAHYAELKIRLGVFGKITRHQAAS